MIAHAKTVRTKVLETLVLIVLPRAAKKQPGRVMAFVMTGTTTVGVVGTEATAVVLQTITIIVLPVPAWTALKRLDPMSAHQRLLGFVEPANSLGTNTVTTTITMPVAIGMEVTAVEIPEKPRSSIIALIVCAGTVLSPKELTLALETLSQALAKIPTGKETTSVMMVTTMLVVHGMVVIVVAVATTTTIAKNVSARTVPSKRRAQAMVCVKLLVGKETTTVTTATTTVIATGMVAIAVDPTRTTSTVMPALA